MQGLTKKQQEIIDFIEGFINEHNYSPSYRDIQKYFGFSSLGSVYNHIQTLKRKKILCLDTKGARSLALQTPLKSSVNVEVPFIGKLREGTGIETFAQIWTIPLPSQMIPTEGEYYILQVEGDELSEEHMQEGDLLLIQPQTHFEDGETVIALIDQHTTLVKKGYAEPPYFRLESINPYVQPLRLREDHVQIQGVVVSLLRHYFT